MRGRELIKKFRAGTWGRSVAISTYVNAAEDVGTQDLLKLLDVLQSKQINKESPAAVKNRCKAFAELVKQAPDPALFGPFIKAMKNGSEPIRQMMVEILPVVNHIPSHADLINQLRSTDTGLRQSTAQILSQVGGKTTFEKLRQFIREPNFNGRLEAIQVLLPIAGHYAIPSLGDILKIGKVHEKQMALKYLSDVNFVAKDVPGALEAIKMGLTATEQRIQLNAIRAFSAVANEDDWFDTIGPFLESLALPLVLASVDGLTRFRSLRSLRALEEAFRMGPNAVRSKVLETATAIGNESILPLLVEALNHRHMNIRNQSAEIITQLSQAEKIDSGRTIIWLLRSRDSTVRRLAVDIANRVGDRTGTLWPKLLTFLRDEDWWVRERVIDALVEMAGTQLTKHVVAYLEDPSDVVRRYAVGVLMRLKDPNSLGALCRTAMSDPDWWVKEWAIQAMGELQDARAVPYILNVMSNDDDIRVICVEALEKLKAVDAAPHVAALLNTCKDDVDLMLAIFSCLSTLNDSSQGQYIAQFQNDRDHRIRDAARALLVKWELSSSQWASTTSIGAQLGMLDQLLYATVKADGDDLMLAAERKAFIKRRGQIIPLGEHVFTEEELRTILLPQISVAQQDDLEQLRDADFSYEVESENLRFRANVFQQTSGLAAVFRTIKDDIPDIAKLGLPEIVRTFAHVKNGLILVGGPTGSGKSTTLAALIGDINKNAAQHIITLEDPIEIIHTPVKSLITQREIGTHSRAFSHALRATLREDPDVILVGEMRDLPTIQFAVTAAETGHLVFGTVHTVSVANSIDRLVNVFPPDEQPQVRSMLSGSLRAVCCQHLLQRIDQEGRVLAVEVMINSDAIANLIRKGKTFQIPSVLATSREQGMQSMDVELMRLYQEGVVSKEEAYMKSNNKADFESLFEEQQAKEQKLAAQGGHVPNRTANSNVSEEAATPVATADNPLFGAAMNRN
jgi:twitching motility protein PilT